MILLLLPLLFPLPMEVKFKKYFAKIYPLPALAMIPDPCFKIDGTFCLFNSYDKNLGVDNSCYKENYRFFFVKCIFSLIKLMVIDVLLILLQALKTPPHHPNVILWAM